MTENRSTTAPARLFGVGLVLMFVGCLLWLMGGFWAIGALFFDKEPISGPLPSLWVIGGLFLFPGAVAAVVGELRARRRDDSASEGTPR